jgi:IPT/TIG domain
MSIPVITFISPTSGDVVGGTSVVIIGSGFTGVTAVYFGVTPAASFTFFSDTLIVAISPPHQDFPVYIFVETPSGTSAASLSSYYLYEGDLIEFSCMLECLELEDDDDLLLEDGSGCLELETFVCDAAALLCECALVATPIVKCHDRRAELQCIATIFASGILIIGSSSSSSSSSF